MDLKLYHTPEILTCNPDFSHKLIESNIVGLEADTPNKKWSGIENLTQLDTNYIMNKRKIIYNTIKEIYKIGAGLKYLVNPDLLQDIIMMYNTFFFQNGFSKIKININWSSLLTPAGGIHVPMKKECCELTIILSTNTFQKLTTNNPSTCGVMCNDILECLLIVIEHELIHGIIFVHAYEKFTDTSVHAMFGGNNKHNQWFMELANKLFGHIRYKHRLIQGNMRF
jgi:hypothetical protein